MDGDWFLVGPIILAAVGGIGFAIYGLVSIWLERDGWS